ncbi:Serogroup A1 [Variovorax sp. PBL-H6]|nr:Serogroup A1 [Variovorax sp. PBL-H6]
MLNAPYKLRRLSAGFTLIEVMIVVAIIGILAAIAVPAYTDYVRRGQLPEAFNELSSYRAKMEQYYQDNRNYGSAAACANNAAASSWNTFPKTIKYFTFDCSTSNSQQGYTITATGAAGSARGHEYKINQAGLRTTTKFKGTALSTPAECWLTNSTTC